MNHFEYFINERKQAPAGQVYLGALLAAVLFFSFWFGSFLFFLSVVIITIFIFLDKSETVGDEWGRIKVVFAEDYLSYGTKKYNYSELAKFSVSKELFGEQEIYMHLIFKSKGISDLYIYLPSEMHLKTVYDIIKKAVHEDKRKTLNFAEQIFIRFFFVN